MAASKKLQKGKFKPSGKFNLAEEKKKQETKKKEESFNVQFEAGVVAPLGFWDPLELLQKGPNQVENFYRLRQAELKHGRVAMVALVGAIVQHFAYLPFFESTGKGLDALSVSPGQFGFSLVVIFAGYLELIVLNQDTKRRAGDFGDPLDVARLMSLPDGADNLEMQNKELSNGRLAMVGIAVTCFAEKLTGLDAVDQLAILVKGGV